MVDYEDSINTENDNVLKYIYKLKEHLENMTLFWQGLTKTQKGNLLRITDPVGPDDFIYAQMSALQSVLNPHTFVSQIPDNDEKNNIILDTFTSFLQDVEREPLFNWSRFQTAKEGFYNTLHLFLNAVQGGFGAQFTIAAQSGITSKIPVNNKEVEQVPYVDVPGIFGFKDKPNTPQQPNYNNLNGDENGRNDY